jgi:exonuclease VII small subunit
MTQTQTQMPDTTDIPFEDGYERLQAISARLNQDEVPVSEMCDLFAEGKGLELALTAFLDTQRGRVEAIERGEGIRAFRITQTAAAPDRELDAGDVPVNTGFAESAPAGATSPAAGASDDDIPF